MHDANFYSKIRGLIGNKSEQLFNRRKGDLEKLHYVIEYCLNSLDFEYKQILESSFLKNEYQYWWLDQYSKATFYRKRNKALTSFLILLETIYENFNDSSVYVNNSNL